MLVILQAIDISVCSDYSAEPQHQSKETFMSRVAELQARIKADQDCIVRKNSLVAPLCTTWSTPFRSPFDHTQQYHLPIRQPALNPHTTAQSLTKKPFG